MNLSLNQVRLLQSYRDKSYVSNILCVECANYYNNIKTIINVPIVFFNFIIIIMNSMTINNKSDYVTIPNIICNSGTVILMGLITNFKIVEKASVFRITGIKFNKLCHNIENKLTNDIENINSIDITNFISEYDNINENLEYFYCNFIKKKIRNKYKNKKTLPNVLNCDNDFIQNPNTPIIHSTLNSNSFTIVPNMEEEGSA